MAPSAVLNEHSRPDSPDSTASTASILSDGEVVPARKKQRTSSASISTPATVSPESETDTASPVKHDERESTIKDNQNPGLTLDVPSKQRSEPPYNHFNTFSASESPEQFLKRLPPSTTSSDKVGDWIWMHNPHYDQTSQMRPEVDLFMAEGEVLLRSFDTYKEEVEMSANRAKVKQAKVNNARKNLPTSLKDLAQKYHVTHGKWMLFPSEKDVDQIWLKVVQACAAGKLGTGAKVAPAGATQQASRLICIYTQDYSDMDDVKRVLLEMQRCGLVSNDGRPIYYKADAWTYLGIDSKNGYGLRASLYSSADLLKEHAKEQSKLEYAVESKTAKRGARDLPW